MLKRSITNKTKYAPNPDVVITVDNKPVVDDDSGEIYMYETSVTLKIKKYETNKELRFKDGEQLQEYFANPDLSDHSPQTSLLDAPEA